LIYRYVDNSFRESYYNRNAMMSKEQLSIHNLLTIR
jgi:hypothetical protein